MNNFENVFPTVPGTGTSEHNGEVKEKRVGQGAKMPSADHTVSKAGEGPLMEVDGCLYKDDHYRKY